MTDGIKEYKEQLYPKKDKKDIDALVQLILIKCENNQCYKDELDKLKEIAWNYKSNKSGLSPSVYDAYKLYNLISSLLKNEKKADELTKDFFEDKEDSIKDLLRNICNEKKELTVDNVKFDIVKGSIYKIKKYFLENNKIKDIRGGSTIIDYLNIGLVKETLEELKLSENNIVYCGGGNILIIVEQGKGLNICKKLEEAYSRIALTVMSAFESIEVDLYDFSFNYKAISDKLNRKLEERKKIKLYKLNPDNDLDKLEIKGVVNIDLSQYEKNIKLKNENVVCELCTIRDAVYIIRETKTLAACPSCLRKHLVGGEKSIFFDDYEAHTGVRMINKYKIKTLKDIDEDIAVIYGDGNNMGKIVMEVSNVFEMMYFSRKTDITTKSSVYEAIKEVMGDNAKFEVIALGGDDIFIIVPAKKALQISHRIIDKFDEAFNKKITMSVGIAFAKHNTPIATIFKVAQDKLKSAKKYLKNNDNIEEGSIDLIKIIGSSNIVEDNTKRLFPMENSMFKRAIKELSDFKRQEKGKSQIYKMSYAQKNMMEQEFELFFQYQESRTQTGLRSLIKRIYNDKNKEVLGSEAPWDELILMWDVI